MAMRTPPPLVDDLMREIFLRVPPHDPSALVSAAAGCKSWRGILANAAFAGEYRKQHGVPPMLGFLYEELDYQSRPSGESYCNWVSHFVPTATFRPPACQDRPYWHVLDSRHGLVLFYTPRKKADFVVCHLVTGNQWEIRTNPKCADIMWWEWAEQLEKLQRIRCNAAVLCAKDPCDHLDCHGGPFRIALAGSVRNGSIARATVYSSETGEWSDMIEVQTPNYIQGTAPFTGTGTGHSAIVGNKVYVPCVESDNVVEYNMDEQKLSVIDAPDTTHLDIVYLMGVEDGMLLFASVVKAGLYLWSMEVGPSGVVGWGRHRIIDLTPLLPPDVLLDGRDVSALGFAEGVGVIFLGTVDGLYAVDLNSGKCKKVHERGHIEKVMPYMSFYTCCTN